MPAELVDSSLLRWIPAAPLLTAAAIGVAISIVRRPLARPLIVGASCSSVLVSVALSLVAFANLIVRSEASAVSEVTGGSEGSAAFGVSGALQSGAPVMLDDTLHTWVGVGVGSSAFSADLSFRFDALSAVMCLLVTSLAFLIHIYSVGTMASDERDDGGLARFFCYLNLSTASMLLLVLADNLLLMLVGWAGVGLCSSLLIGFWYGDSDNAYAGGKAFLVNRVGDFGLLLGILLLFWANAEAGTPAVSFRAIEAGFPAIASQTLQLPAWLGGFVWGLPTLIGLCLFLGIAARSALFPLHGWLPDSTSGPTPASALIQAVTSVAAGVYLLVRLSFLYAAAPGASALIAWTGGATALLAATLACGQSDIRKVLAYATMSQAGTMFMAAGVGAYGAAVVHLLTHAFFMALLVMGAGAVVVALHHERNMKNMGGLGSRLKRTWWVMLIGSAALAGLPPLSGFFSKDEIFAVVFLAEELPAHRELYWLALVTGGLTTFYVSRLFMLVFHGKTRVPRRRRVVLQDPGDLIMWPLYVLAALAALGGLLGVPQFWGDMMGIEQSDSLGNFLSGVLASGGPHDLEPRTAWQLIGSTLAASGLGLGIAYLLYVARPELRDKLADSIPFFRRALSRRDWVDAVHAALFVRLPLFVSDQLFRRVEVWLFEGVLVQGTATVVRGLASHGLKHLQSGLTQGYLLVMVAGAIATLVYLAG